jgi:hypothetical protein
MKKLLLLTFLAGALVAPANSSNKEQSSAQVYICTGTSAKSYHAKSNCHGISSCKGTIKKVSLADAKKMGRRACKICYQ